MNLKVVDAIMGSGKTSAAINYINNAPADCKFIFCTPLLSEVDRIIMNCSCKNFKQPTTETQGSKIQSIKNLLAYGDNIATTHVLLNKFDDEIRELISTQHYILVLDETLETTVTPCISSYDKQIFINSYCEVAENGEIVWKDGKRSFLIKDEWAQKIDEHRLYMSNNIILETLPIQDLNAFDEIILLTYNYKSSVMRCYFDFFEIPYEYWYIAGTNNSNLTFANTPAPPRLIDYSGLINICNNERLNHIGKEKFALSKGWYNKQDNFNEIKRHTHNYFQNICKSPTSKNMWTTFKQYRPQLKGKGYTKGFVPCSQRGTNEYRSKDSAVYLVNRFVNPHVKTFFAGKDITLDEDGFALNEMLQWLWRSAIRDGKRINLYIPSSRMRGLLVGWLNSNKEGTD